MPIEDLPHRRRCRCVLSVFLVMAAVAVPATCVAQTEGADEREAAGRIEDLVRAADAGESTAQLAFDAAELGMAALWSAADRMDLEQDAHRAPFLLLAEHAAVSRKVHPELLRLYDPPAHRAFYTPAGSDLQAVVGRALAWKNPPRHMPQAVVMAAPEPTLAWLTAQCEGTPADPDRLLAILQAWGIAIGIGRERQYMPRLRELAAQLAASPALRADETLLLGVIRFVRYTGSREAAGSLAACAEHRSQDIRRAAAAALGTLADDSALQALLAWAAREEAPQVQAGIAEALGNWPDKQEAGAACLRLFEQATEAKVRRSVLHAAGTSKWPQRDSLIRQALERRESFLLGAALAAEAVPGLEKELMRLLATWQGKTPEPPLVDALAASRVAAAAPALSEALQRESNIAIRLKLIFALEKIGGGTSEQALLQALEATDSELEGEYLVAAIGRLKLSAAIPQLSELARRHDIPMNVRVQAIWGLGCMPDPSARAEIEKIEAQFTELFAANEDGHLDRDAAFHLSAAKPHLHLALYRMGSASAGKEISRLFADGDPLAQTVLLLGILDQKTDHPIIAEGLKSSEFFVLCTAIAAARESNPAKYRARILRLAASPFVQAAADVRGESWNLHRLLENP